MEGLADHDFVLVQIKFVDKDRFTIGLVGGHPSLSPTKTSETHQPLLLEYNNKNN